MPHTFRAEYVNCCKARCNGCPHGPYWYEYWHQGGVLHKRYRGKNDPRAEGPVPSHVHIEKPHPHDAIFCKRTATAALAFEILGLPRRVDLSVLHQLYKALVKQHHPDRGGDTRTFQRIEAAYSYLKTLY